MSGGQKGDRVNSGRHLSGIPCPAWTRGSRLYSCHRAERSPEGAGVGSGGPGVEWEAEGGKWGAGAGAGKYSAEAGE